MRKSFFFDTSALVKLYHEEGGTEELTHLVSSENPVILISDITIIEMISALAKKVRTEEIDTAAFNAAVSAFENDLLNFHIINIGTKIRKQASDLLKTAGLKYALKTLDSLQLASALVVSEVSMLDLFIAGDSVLLRAAENVGLHVMSV